MKASNGKKRVVITGVYPEIDGGKYPIKRIPGELVMVSADLLADGHDIVNGEILYKHEKDSRWYSTPMKFDTNDRWKGEFKVDRCGSVYYTFKAWVDHTQSWIHDIKRKVEAGQNVDVEIRTGIKHLRSILKKADKTDKTFIEKTIQLSGKSYAKTLSNLLGSKMDRIIKKYPLKEYPVTYPKKLKVNVQRDKNLFSSWYEFFPRSVGKKGKHGTFEDCIRLLPIISRMGFDVIYFPPVHPVGIQYRKGKNNSTICEEKDPGSPWAIGSSLGGHKSIHPDLGDFDSFEKLIREANKNGIEIALDLAYQCSPDHPYVKEHPEWFRWRADGSIQYAENPPKKYQDVLPFNFETDEWLDLWKELKSIVEFWIDKGIKIFRVDNPHTKPFIFWEWLISNIHRNYQNVIFLSEAFTRPKIMNQLAKIGFNQSYTYFTWREHKDEIIEYIEELTQSESREYFRPNFWPNTPDINPYYLQNTGYNQSAIRFVLAATLSSNYGIYGPVFDFLVNKPVPGKEEYLDSEKYEIGEWKWKEWTPMRKLISKVNKIRRSNPALQQTNNIIVCENDNDKVLSFLKIINDKDNILYIIVNLDAIHTKSGWTRLPLEVLDIDLSRGVEMHDLLDDKKYIWKEEWNYFELRPDEKPCHIFSIKKL